MCIISQLIHHLLKGHFDSVSKAIIKQQKATQTLKGPFFQDFLKVKANRNVKPLSGRGSESDFYVKSWDEFMQALRDRSITDCSSERENSETSHELEENLTDNDDQTVASSAEVADHRWWCPSPDALDSLSTHSSLNEFDRNYGIRSELPDFVRARGFRESDQPGKPVRQPYLSVKKIQAKE